MQTVKKLSDTRLLIGFALLTLALMAVTLLANLNHQPHALPAHKVQAQPKAVVAHTVQHTTTQPVINAMPISYSSPYVGTARQAAASVGISPDLFVRQIEKESGFNPNAVSPVGAVGIAQFMPSTAASMGVNPYDPVQSLYGAARFMANLSNMYGGNYAKALAAYNAGPGNVNYAVSVGGGNWLAYTPYETQNYVNSIMYSSF